MIKVVVQPSIQNFQKPTSEISVPKVKNNNMATDSTIVLTFLLPLGISLILILFVLLGFIRMVCSSSEALHHQHLHEVITQKCNKKSKECYSILDGNIIKISCPVCVQNEVNCIFV